MFSVLVQARLRMLMNTVRASTHWQQATIVLLSVFGALLFVLVALLCAAGLRLAQNGVPVAAGLVPAAVSLTERAYEYFFFFVLAGSVPFVAATLFQADDLPLLLTTPLPPRAIVAAKILDATAVNAAQSAALGLPVLIGLGAAAGLSAAGWGWMALSTLLLLVIPPAATALLLLLAARVLGMRRVRIAVMLVSVGLGLAITMAAVIGASHMAQSGVLSLPRLQAALHGETPLAGDSLLPEAPFQETPSFLPSAWASAMLKDTAGGHALGRRGTTGLLLMLASAALLIGVCLPAGARVLTSDAFLEPQETGRKREASPRSHQLSRLWSPATAGLLTKDARYVQRDLILQGQIGTALLLFLVPFLLRAAQGHLNSADADLYGLLTLGMIGLIAYMVTSIVSLSSVGLEGRGAWMVLAAPVSRGLLLRAKWLGAFGLSFGVVSVLILIAWPAFSLPAATIGAALLGMAGACFALTGLGVGLAGLFPRFVYENPAHRASVWALLLGFVLASGYVLFCGLLSAGGAVLVAQDMMTPQTAYTVGITAFLLLSLTTGIFPVWLATRRLEHYEWEF